MMSDSPIFMTRRFLQRFDAAYAAEINSRFGKKGNTRSDLILTVPQYFMLCAIARLDKPTQTDLVNETGVDRSTVATIIRCLKRKGYISRVRSRDDARAYVVRVAEKGAKVLAAARPIVQRLEETFLSHLPIRQREAFLKAIQTLAFLDLNAAEEQQRQAA